MENCSDDIRIVYILANICVPSKPPAVYSNVLEFVYVCLQHLGGGCDCHGQADRWDEMHKVVPTSVIWIIRSRVSPRKGWDVLELKFPRGTSLVHIQIECITCPRIRMQSFTSLDTSGFPNSQRVKLTAEWSIHSNRPSVFLSFSPIQSSSVEATETKENYISINMQYLIW